MSISCYKKVVCRYQQGISKHGQIFFNTRRHFMKSIFLFKCLLILILRSTPSAMAQCRSSPELWKELLLIENNPQATENKKKAAEGLKLEFERCKLPPDSVYAKILHRLALYEYLLNNNRPTSSSIDYTTEAIRINTSGSKGASPKLAVNSFSNLAIYYRNLMLYDKALDYYDSTIARASRYPDQDRFVLSSRYDRTLIFFITGNYQKSIDESYAGLLESKIRADSLWMTSFLNQIAQSSFSQNQLTEATRAADKAIDISNILLRQLQHASQSATTNLKRLYFELSTAFKTKALTAEQMGDYPLAEKLFNQTISTRFKSVEDNGYGQVAGDYSDFGNFYLNSVKSPVKANACYYKTLEYGRKSDDRDRLAKAYLHLGQSFYRVDNYKLAESQYLKSLNQFVQVPFTDFFQQPTSIHLQHIVNNEFVLVYLRNRLELLITLFKNTGKTPYLDKAVATALLTDTLITRFRHEQMGEQNKLFWREHTRSTSAMSIEAAYLKRDFSAAFFFMEKSRAVLLNDKLNELGSFAYLPTTEAVKEQQMRNQLLTQQEDLAKRISDNTIEQAADDKLLRAQDTFSKYIKSLEKKYPAYYLYKYSDSVPPIVELQQYLQQNNQRFVHYFMGDTITYVLGITGNDVKMLRITKNEMYRDQVVELLQMLSDKQFLNNQFKAFSSHSYNLYQHLFEPLKLSKGRVIICADNFLLPFESLATDKDGRRMLIDDYAFSYVYSARYLLRSFSQNRAKGDFLGFAPVSFRPPLQLADLKNSARSLNEAAKNYRRPVLYNTTDATRKNFLSTIGNFEVVNVFSHARADDGDEQPMLYMQDSVIRLSELQYLQHPSTRLVVLSACQTSMGRNATGEGIYSMARGFAAAGIPSVAATIWKADEEAIYAISKLFHQHLSNGLPMDVALQKAKQGFKQDADRERQLPYYWANMMIIGKSDPLTLDQPQNDYLWYLGGAIIVIFSLWWIASKRTRSRAIHPKN